jgi:hypothetical protein
MGAALKMMLLAWLGSVGTVVRGTKVEMFYEVGCPLCQKVMKEVIKPALSSYNPAAATIELFPFGNAYYVTSKCAGAGTYQLASRKCWGSSCGAGVAAPMADCFTGDIVCQHGQPECTLNRYVACAKQVSNSDFSKYGNFAVCIDGEWQQGQDYDFPAGTCALLAEDCAKKAGMDFNAIKACADGVGGDAALKAVAAGTPPHTVVPFLTADGVPVADLLTPQGTINPAAIPAGMSAPAARLLQEVQV